MGLKAGFAVAALLLAGACGGSDEPDTDTASASPPAATQSTAPAASLESALIEPGTFGPYVVGMPASDALDQGLVRQPTDEPPCPAYAATEPFDDVAVLFSSADAPKLRGVLVKVPGPRTAEGIGIGDSLADLRAAYGDQLRREEGEYGEIVFRIYDGDGAVGFTSFEGAEPSNRIDAIEVFATSDPVIWDGC